MKILNCSSTFVIKNENVKVEFNILTQIWRRNIRTDRDADDFSA